MADDEFIRTLESIIQDRLRSADPDSYTAQLAAAGTLRQAQKVGEEGVEVALAAATGDTNDLLAEAADLIFHLLVLLNANELQLSDVESVLRKRHGN